MRIFQFNLNKINLSKTIFYTFIAISCGLILLLTINVFTHAYSQESLNLFLSISANKQTPINYRTIIIIRYILNVVLIIFITIYTYFAYSRIKVGNGFAMLWTLILIGTILGSWLVAHNSGLWFNITMTIICSLGLANTFYLMVQLSQMRTYQRYRRRFGS